MTVKTHQILCLSMLILLAGCNGDIFVDDYMPKGQNEITISANDNNKEITFNSDNWGISWILIETSEQFNTNTYTLDGELTHLPLEEKELCTIHLKNDYMDVIVERKSGNKLKVILNENLMNESLRMLITVGNSFKYEYIEVLLSPTHKYQIDRIVYDWDKFEFNDNNLMIMQTLTINNNSDSPMTMPFHPFRESTREINFTFPTVPWDSDIFSKLLGIPLPEITIPDIVDGKPMLHNTKVAFDIREQHLDTNLNKELSVDVTIDGFDKRKVIVFNVMRSYSVPCNIYMSNHRTGKELIFSGKLYSKEPIDYLIFKRAVDEN